MKAAVSSAAASSRFLQCIPRDFARQHLIVSQGDEGDVERLVVAAGTDPLAVHNVGVRLGVAARLEIADGEQVARAIDAAYERFQREIASAASGSRQSAEHAMDDSRGGGGGDVDRLLAEADRDLLTTQGKGPVVKLVDALLFEALGRSATDIHIQPLADRTLVRYRLDGVLHTVREIHRPPGSPGRGGNDHGLSAAVLSRIKVMGRMDIAERRVPQDGRASVTIGDRSIDLRISTVPTSYGERAVIRLLDNSKQLCDFSHLGMPPEVADALLARATHSGGGGIILVTGPTGSGKTTTLYSTLRRIGSTAQNIMTIEDPIEYELSVPGEGITISQMQVNPRKGVTFATGLRHILRQDPDVIMVGEIRDGDTARMAIQSSLTGHLVLSTLHTNDSAGAITRLIDLGIEPYLVAASLSAVLAQRLLRLKHQGCDGQGCGDCFNTGFRGRTGIFELLLVHESIRKLITHNTPLSSLRQAATSTSGGGAGMRTLLDEGRRLVAAGLTTQLEMDRVVQHPGAGTPGAGAGDSVTPGGAT